MITLDELIVIDLETRGGGSFGELQEVYCLSWSTGSDCDVLKLRWRPDVTPIEVIKSTWESIILDRVPVFHNAAFDVAVLRSLGLSIPHYHCTMIMGYDLNPNMREYRGERYSLNAWGERLGLPKLKSPTFETWSDEMVPYARRDAELTWKVLSIVLSQLQDDERAWEYYVNVDLPFIEVVMELNSTGVYVDQTKLKSWENEIQPVVDSLQKQLCNLVEGVKFPGDKLYHKTQKERADGAYLPEQNKQGKWVFVKDGEFNPNSGTHLKIAYKEMYDIELDNTQAENLECYNCELTDILLEYKKLTKLTGTYIKPFQEKVCADGRVRASWRQELITGRISSKNPSLQVLPKRNELGATFRKFIVPEPGNIFVGVDLANIQLRVLAALMAQYFDEECGYLPDDVVQMLKIFYHNPELPEGDYHGVMSKIMGISRSESKTVTFGRIFGLGFRAFVAKLGVEDSVGRSILDKVEQKNPSFNQYKRGVIDGFYKNDGLGYTLYGRRLIYPTFTLDKGARENQELPTGEVVTRREVFKYLARGERQAFNAVIQGTEADIAKILMLVCKRGLKDLDCKLIIQVHDELLYEVPEENLDKALMVITTAFNNMDMLPYIPVCGTPGVGYNWLEVH